MSETPVPLSLRDALNFRRMKAYQLAAKLGVTPSSVSSWETGRMRPRVPTQRLVAVILEYPVEIVESWFPKAA